MGLTEALSSTDFAVNYFHWANYSPQINSLAQVNAGEELQMLKFISSLIQRTHVLFAWQYCEGNCSIMKQSFSLPCLNEWYYFIVYSIVNNCCFAPANVDSIICIIICFEYFCFPCIIYLYQYEHSFPLAPVVQIFLLSY